MGDLIRDTGYLRVLRSIEARFSVVAKRTTMLLKKKQNTTPPDRARTATGTSSAYRDHGARVLVRSVTYAYLETDFTEHLPPNHLRAQLHT